MYEIESRIKAHLRSLKPSAGDGLLFASAAPMSMLDLATSRLLEARRACARYGPGSPQARAAAGRYSQVAGRVWRAYLVTELTDFALAGITGTTRERVRLWQRATFGQAICSRDLSRWAQPGCGSRGTTFTVPPARVAVSIDLWTRYQGALAASLKEVESQEA